MKATSLQDAFEQICALEAPLHERMAAFSAAVREFGLPFAEAYDDLVQRIRSGEAGSTAPEPGEPMPELLPDCAGRSWLIDLVAGAGHHRFNRGRSYKLLSHRAGLTPGLMISRSWREGRVSRANLVFTRGGRRRGQRLGILSERR